MLEYDWQVVTAVAVSIGAWFTYRNYRRSKLFDLPTPVLKVRPPLETGLSTAVDFHLKEEDRKWLVTGVSVRHGRRHRYVALVGDAVQDKQYGQVVGFRVHDDAWQRQIIYDPPVSRGVVLLHDSVPDAFWLVITVCLRSHPRSKSRLLIRRSKYD